MKIFEGTTEFPYKREVGKIGNTILVEYEDERKIEKYALLDSETKEVLATFFDKALGVVDDFAYYRIGIEGNTIIGIFDTQSKKWVAYNWIDVNRYQKLSDSEYGVRYFVLKNPVTGKCHIFDLQEYRKNSDSFNKEIAGAESLDTESIFALSDGKKKALFSGEHGYLTDYVADEIKSGYHAAAVTTGDKTKVYFWENLDYQTQKESYDSVEFDACLVFCKSTIDGESEFEIYSASVTKNVDFIGTVKADEIKVLSSTYDSRTKAEYLVALKRGNKYSVESLMMENKKLTASIPVGEGYDEVEYHYNYAIPKKDGKIGLIVCEASSEGKLRKVVIDPEYDKYEIIKNTHIIKLSKGNKSTLVDSNWGKILLEDVEIKEELFDEKGQLVSITYSKEGNLGIFQMGDVTPNTIFEGATSIKGIDVVGVNSTYGVYFVDNGDEQKIIMYDGEKYKTLTDSNEDGTIQFLGNKKFMIKRKDGKCELSTINVLGTNYFKFNEFKTFNNVSLHGGYIVGENDDEVRIYSPDFQYLGAFTNEMWEQIKSGKETGYTEESDCYYEFNKYGVARIPKYPAPLYSTYLETPYGTIFGASVVKEEIIRMKEELETMGQERVNQVLMELNDAHPEVYKQYSIGVHPATKEGEK